MGYTQNGYVLYELTTGRTIYSRHVTFAENVFSFRDHHDEDDSDPDADVYAELNEEAEAITSEEETGTTDLGQNEDSIDTLRKIYGKGT